MKKLVTLMTMALLFSATGLANGTPAVSLNTEAEWDAAIGTTVFSVSSSRWGDIQTDNPGFDVNFGGTYSLPELDGVQEALYVL